jgi:arsenite/tail-anchored protein-transporting ATPase
VAPSHGDGPFAHRQHALLLKRILFFGGKGGVGKTTCASAVALAASREGKRVLLVSTDPAHSTSDIFGTPFEADEREIHPRLYGLEVDANLEARRYIDNAKAGIARMFSPAVAKEAGRQIELASSMPGVEEVALFDRIGDLIVDRFDAYDLLIFDTAPTGHTLRLLRMPELVSAWITALSKRRRALLALNQDIDQVRLAPEAINPDEDPILKTLDARRDKLEQVRARLMQHNFTGFVLVVIPERLPIEETARAAGILRESNVNVCGVVVNRVLPPDAEGDFYRSRRQQEQIYVDEIRQRFSAYPLAWVPQLATDVYGLENLERVSYLLMRESESPM